MLKKLLRGTQVHVSSLWWCMHLQKVKPSTNKTYKKTCVPEFPILSNLKNYLHVYLWFLDMNMYKEISKHSWKKIVQLLRTVNTYFQKNVEYGIEHDVAYGVCIGTLDIHFWTLQQIWWITCNLSRWWIWQSVSL